MIISASRRTDIPACYSDWFFRRIREGYVCVRNPMNAHQVSRVSLDPSVVDGIVFWTKNPVPMLPRLDEIKAYPYYFQFTVNPYGRDVERNLPSKKNVIIPAFQALARKIGPERVLWRYDPILLTPKHSIDWHAQCFEALAKALAGYTRKCIISFLDLYRSTQRNAGPLGLLPLGPAEMGEIARRFSEIARKFGLALESCAEAIDLEAYGIKHGHCVDATLFEALLGCRLDLSKDRNQRRECGCAASVDIGMYNTCPNHCLYCYANHSQTAVRQNHALHNPDSPLLSGAIGPEDVVTIREAASCKDRQIRLSDL